MVDVYTLQYRLENRTYSTINRFRHGLTAVLTIEERPDILVNLRRPDDNVAIRASDHGTRGQGCSRLLVIAIGLLRRPIAWFKN
jgi:hypothetical protein